MRFSSILTAALYSSASLVSLAAADFHLLADYYDCLLTDCPTWRISYAPSNQYTCGWLEGKGNYNRVIFDVAKVPVNGFTSENDICGATKPEFRKRNEGGFNVYSKGGYIGYCVWNNPQGPALNCNSLTHLHDAYEKYVCYSYVCEK